MAMIVTNRGTGGYEVYPTAAHLYHGVPGIPAETWVDANDVADDLDGKPFGYWRGIPERNDGMAVTS